MVRWTKFALRFARDAIANPLWTVEALRTVSPAARGMRFASAGPFRSEPGPEGPLNPLAAYFDAHRQGPGILKWEHYFDIYHRHFQKFIGREVHFLEIGVYSGGSLEMWKQYLGARSRIYGVDIEEACRVYASEQVEILIGDQGDRSFWANFRRQVPLLDVVVDDGGHVPDEQIVSLEELLPHLRGGGVYVCEDTHVAPNRFTSYVSGLASRLNEGDPSPFLKAVDSVHLYPYVTVIERNDHERVPLRSTHRGTEWQPFLGRVNNAQEPAPTGIRDLRK
ncbi:MAG: class I SAM-dependent methyltransferase [Bauldia sp.]